MKKFRSSLLRQYLLIVFIATMIIPLSIPLLSSFLYNLAGQENPPEHELNENHIEKSWDEAAKSLENASDEQIRDKLSALNKLYPEATIFWVDETGTTKDKFPSSTQVPASWTISSAIQFIQENRGYQADPFTVVSLIGENPGEGFMVLQIPRSELKSNDWFNKYGYWLLTGTFLVLILFIVASSLFFYNIRKRLVHLQQAMEMSGDDGIPSSLAVKKDDEIGRLVKSFNRMVKELKLGKERERKEEKLRKELVANISHDLRTPLTAIRGHAYSLKKEALSKSGQESLNIIDEKTDYIGQLIDNLLSYSLLTGGKYPCQPEKTDMLRLLRTSVATWYPVFEEHQFEIVLDFPEKSFTWEVDPQWMNRILDNLFQNIVRHARDGKFVALRVVNESIIIEDHGPGMTGVSMQKGAGVGLSIVSLMVKEMGLNWEVETGGHGTKNIIRKE
ncbi:MAG: HAMP domain-containing sensor histidine kinase [Thermoactinomyces sp.]